MDLEKLLKDRAARAAEARAQEEAAAVAAEQAALEEQEAQKAEALSATIQEVDDKIAETERLLQELEGAHGAAGEKGATVKENKEAKDAAAEDIASMFDEYGEVLAAEGITSVDELVAAPDFSETNQVTALREAGDNLASSKDSFKGAIKGRALVKRQAREALQTPVGEEDATESSLLYRELVEGLTERLSMLNERKAELVTQTPEGQAAEAARIAEEQEALKEKVLEPIRRELSSAVRGAFVKHPNGTRFDPDRLAKEATQLALNIDAEKMTAVGAEPSEVVRDLAFEGIDVSLEATYLGDRKNAAHEAAFKKIEEQTATLEELKDIGNSLLLSEEELTKKLEQLLTADETYRESINTSFHRDGHNRILRIDTPAVLAREYVKDLSVLTFESRGHKGQSFGHVNGAISVSEYVNQILTESLNATDLEKGMYAALKGAAKAPDLKKVLEVAKAQTEAFAAVKNILDQGETPEIDAATYVKPNQSFGGNKRVLFALEPEPDQDLLPPTLDNLKSDLDTDRRRLEEKKQQAKEDFSEAFADHFTIGETAYFERNNREALARVSTYERNKPIADEIQSLLDLAERQNLEPDTQLEINQGRIYAAGWREKKRDVDSKLLLKEREITTTQVAIDNLNNEAKAAENDKRWNSDLLGRKASARAASLKELTTTMQRLTAEKQILDTEKADLVATEEKLKDLGAAVAKMGSLGLSPESRTVGGVIAEIKAGVETVVLSEEDDKLQQQHQAMRGRANVAQQNIRARS